MPRFLSSFASRFASSFASRQFLLFLLTGGCAAAVNFGSRILYNRAMSFSSAVICAYITGMITAFVLARLFVFRATTQAVHHAAGYFILVNLVAVAQTWGISMLLVNWGLPWLGVTHYTRDIAHGVGVVVPVFTSYLGHKHFSFR